ncbi:Sensor kinase CusS [Methyloligella halotolerans]|uniref:histidine kinase n=1 Tax=Methyloligella halotolerans TaxID=1177755 RepID=A0A1E2RXF9_9HYPH|nr:HAMP domain-containing sensor histidine kinase [Methyloligella halotolerans]ODA66820.1 Sensor kinase CusS [Methyloligella halotolerans]
MTAPSKLFRTTAFRLSLLYLAVFGLAASLAIGYIYWNVNILLSRQLDETIQAELGGLAEQYRAGGLRQLVRTIAERSETPGNSLYYVADNDGHRIAGNLGSISPELLKETGPVEFTYQRPTQGGAERRLAFANVFHLAGGTRLLVGRDIEDRRVLSRVTRSAILWGLALMALVGLGGGLLVSRNLLSRIDAITDTSRKIMAGDLSGRLPRNRSGDELDRLSESLNQMLARIEQLMAGLREVSDNIAHDLKTPLTRLRNRVERALHEPQGESDRQETLEKTIEEADNLIKTFNALLSIARMEAGAGTGRWESLDASALIADVAELYEPVAEERGLMLRAEADDPLPIMGDRQLLGQALANLVDNAIKHGRPEAETGAAEPIPDIRIAAYRAGVDTNGGSQAARGRGVEMAEIVVSDRGPGIPAADRERVLERFVRLEASRSAPGSGLGLSLVAAVARLHGGDLKLAENGPGLKAVLTLPMQTDADAPTAIEGR